ncbi:MAG: hypothetical protein JNK01_13955 [Devosia sp.]|nr:hypothetical protein [Devosia sp.]
MTETKTEPDTGRRDCAVFVTHVWGPQIATHYERLKREAAPILDVFLAFQQGDDEAAVPAGMTPDLVVRMADSAAHFPLRYQEYLQRSSPWGYVDLVWMTAFLDPRLGAYDRFWLVEYDVDFSGNWSSFFGAAASYEGDLLATRLRPLSADPGFYFTSIYEQPQAAPDDPLIAFMPISRLSRQLIDHYRTRLLQVGWCGHFEMVLPSLARLGGYSIAEIGGYDALVPPERRGLHYDGTFEDLLTTRSTHAYRPPRAFSYFVQSPRKFRQRNRIYHPVKVGWSLNQRLRPYWLPALQRLRALSRRLRGKA